MKENQESQGISPPPTRSTTTTISTTTNLYALPDLAHDIIASYLSLKDQHHMIETSKILQRAYGGRVTEVVVTSHPPTTTIITSLFSHRHGVAAVKVSSNTALEGLVEAMDRGHCPLVQSITTLSSFCNEEANFQAGAAKLFNTMANGTCPHLHTLRLRIRAEQADATVRTLGDALRSRVQRHHGCCGLKELEVLEAGHSRGSDSGISTLSPILSSGACEVLERLVFGTGGWSWDRFQLREGAGVDIAEWLTRTNGNNLCALIIPTLDLSKALTSGGRIAPGLQDLQMAVHGADSEEAFLQMCEAVEKGAWPGLRRLDYLPHGDAEERRGGGTEGMLQRLVEATMVGAPDIRTLGIAWTRLQQPGEMLARALGNGIWPRLEEVNLFASSVTDEGLTKLARAWESGAPSTTTMRDLCLSCGEFGAEGVRELAGAVMRGALPNLEILNLGNSDGVDDEAMVYLAQAMEAGALARLQELHLGGFGMGIGDEGALALLRALTGEPRACPSLKAIRWANNHISHEVKRQMLADLEAARGSGGLVVEFDDCLSDEELGIAV